MRVSFVNSMAILLALTIASTAWADAFNGQGDVQTDSLGYYYQVGGGLFPNGQTRNGDNASGGTIRFATDDPAWGAYPQGTWVKDDWFPVTSSIALTLKDSGNNVVFDNNGIETNTVPAGYWNSTQVPGSTTVGYSMSNNWDWIYTGLFQLTQETVVSSLTGYFIVGDSGSTPDGNFDPDSAAIRYRMNIFSEVAGQLPANTGGFDGDVFSSDATGGAFSWSDTGYDRVTASSVANIYRLTYTLNAPLTLQAGNYYFGSDAAVVTPVPVAAFGGIALFGLLAFKRRRQADAD